MEPAVIWRDCVFFPIYGPFSSDFPSKNGDVQAGEIARNGLKKFVW